ncbi:MAG TPA: Calx-beta domain-containing protein, partial [Candidatus Eisenbacteria bacterium]
TLSVGDVSVTEGNSGTTAAELTVTLSAASGQSVTIDFQTADGTALSPDDYQATTGSLTFAPGETFKTVSVQVGGDLLNETDETFLVGLSNPTNATVSDDQALVTLLNDDGVPSFAIADASIAEGNAGTTNATFTVTLSAASGQTMAVDFRTTDGTALSLDDYQAAAGSLTFAAGETTKTVSILVVGDLLNESDETCAVDLSNATNATVVDGHALVTILNDDGVPSLSIADASVMEGNSGTTNATFTVTLSAVSGLPVTVDYETSDGTALDLLDYQAAAGSLTFAPGETTKSIVVAVAGDLLNEADEAFLVQLSNAGHATVSDGEATGAILNDDGVPSLSIGYVSVTEGDSGTKAAQLTVTLSAASGQPVTVDFQTADATAQSPDDYQATSGSLTFAPGETVRTVSVLVVGDLLNETDETIAVDLSNATNATVSEDQALVTILNDDAVPTLMIGDVSITEGNAGSTAAQMTVTLSAAGGQPVTVDFQTADGTALSAEDYLASGGSLTFAPGETTKTFIVSITGDLLNEADEVVRVDLSNPTNATVTDAQGRITILNDDGAPSLSIEDASVTEGNSGTTNATFTVTLSAASGLPVSVDYATSDGTALDPDDYQAAAGSLTFAPGETTKNLAIAVVGDLLNETDEALLVGLSNATNAAVSDDQGLLTILNDDGVPSLSIGDVIVTEGNSGTSAAQLTVTLSAASGQPVTVDYSTVNGSAVAPGDYVVGVGTVTFAPGEVARSVPVLVNGDMLSEASETFVVRLASPVMATILDADGLVTILDDDAAPVLTIGDVTVLEGTGGATSVTLSVRLSPASGQTVSVDWATADDMATAPADYVASGAVLTFAPGDTVKTVTVSIVPDINNEPTEDFFVRLTNPLHAVAGDGEAVVVILDDDAVSGVGEPGNFRTLLAPNYPNPFQERTTIPWSLAEPGSVHLQVFDVSGRLIRTLVDGQRSAGEFRAEWDGRDDAGSPVARGLYLLSLRTTDGQQVRRLILR